MKPVMSFLLAGAMLASVSAASTVDQWSEARFQAKMGRPTPAAELERKYAAKADQNWEDCRVNGCCRAAKHGRAAHHRNAGSVTPFPAQGWLSAKLGRGNPAVTAACTGRHEAGNRMATAAIAASDGWLAKWGRTAGTGTAATGATGSSAAVTAAETMPACCG